MDLGHLEVCLGEPGVQFDGTFEPRKGLGHLKGEVIGLAEGKLVSGIGAVQRQRSSQIIDGLIGAVESQVQPGALSEQRRVRGIRHDALLQIEEAGRQAVKLPASFLCGGPIATARHVAGSGQQQKDGKDTVHRERVPHRAKGPT